MRETYYFYRATSTHTRTTHSRSTHTHSRNPQTHSQPLTWQHENREQIDDSKIGLVHLGDINNLLLPKGAFNVEIINIKFHFPIATVKTKHGNH